MNKVLITGVAGLLGSRLASWIIENTDYEVIGIDDLSGGFNENIHKIGPAKAFNLLKKHGSVEEISKTINAECLNYESCKELFSYKPSKIFSDKLNIKWNEYDSNIDGFVDR